MSTPETNPPVQADKKVFPCDLAVRARALALLEAGITKAEMARGSGINAGILYPYLDEAGNTYPGVTETYEHLLAAWMDRRELQLLSGIPTIWTGVAAQMESVAMMLNRCSIMGKVIGDSGIGKTRGCLALREKDKSIILIFADGETGTRDGIRRKLFAEVGIRGPRKSSNRRLAMMQDLYKRLRATRRLIVVDQAHMLSCPAINLLVELYNATVAPQMFVGTDKLVDKLERDEQWASRLNFTWLLDVADIQPEDGKTISQVRPLVTHLVSHKLQGSTATALEQKRLVPLCEKIALADGHFRRVEQRLNMMLYLHSSPANKKAAREWCDLFTDAAELLPGLVD